MKRIVVSSATELARAVSNVTNEKNKVPAISTGRRPIRSAIMLMPIEPIRIPNKAALMT